MVGLLCVLENRRQMRKHLFLKNYVTSEGAVSQSVLYY